MPRFLISPDEFDVLWMRKNITIIDPGKAEIVPEILNL